VKGAAGGARPNRRRLSGEVRGLDPLQPRPVGAPDVAPHAGGPALPAEQHEETDRQFESLMKELSATGEFVTAEALADPASATVSTWGDVG
jgi:hypothetical protein